MMTTIKRNANNESLFDEDVSKPDSISNKKAKVDEFDIEFSSVVHFRNISDRLSDEEVALLAAPFGRISHMRNSVKNTQALIDMVNKESAIKMVKYYNEHQVIIDGRNVYAQFSNHETLDTRVINESTRAAIEKSNQIFDEFESLQARFESGEQPTLHLLIERSPSDPIYPFDHLALYKIFSVYGTINRIVSFNKGQQSHGLIEFSASLEAHVAKLHTNNVCMYGNALLMKVDFATNQSRLRVERQSNRCRDYTLAPLTSEEEATLKTKYSNITAGTKFEQKNVGDANSDLGRLISAAYGAAQSTSMNSDPINNNPMMHPLMPSMQQQQQQHPQPNLGQSGGNNEAINVIASIFSSLAGQSTSNSNALAALGPLFSMAANKSDTNSYVANGHSAGAIVNNQPPLPMNNQENTGRTLIVNNLNAEKANPDDLFTIFGVYGDINRVKIMYNKRNTALIQFVNASQAETARRYMDNATFWGTSVKVYVSKQDNIQLPKDPSETNFTKDFSNSILRRFQRPNSKNFSNIYPPCRTLHLSNLPDGIEENEIIDLFEQNGFPVHGFKFMEGSHRMGLLTLDSVENAIHALMRLHNKQMGEKQYLRISFGKSTPPEHL